MNSIGSLCKGFFITAAAIGCLSIIELAINGDPILALIFLMILIIPLTYASYLWRRKKDKQEKIESIRKWGNLLFALQGAALACWIYDLVTTFYAINVAKVAYEINPLGWPLGALGAFSYYVPTITLSYILIYRINQKISLYAATPITLVALCMGSMNLNAGFNNFWIVTLTALLPSKIGFSLLSVLVVVDLAYTVFLIKTRRKQVQFRSQKSMLRRK